MKVTVHGWNRYMGDTELANYNLSHLPIHDKFVHSITPTILKSHDGISVYSRRQELRLSGNYQMQVQFSQSDVVHLFKSVFGSELSTSLIERHGFTISPVLTKAILRTLPLGDLIAMFGGSSSAEESATAEKLVEPDRVT